MAIASLNAWLAYCRQGFEADVATELAALAAGKTQLGEACLLHHTDEPLPELAEVVFARQMLHAFAEIAFASTKDRVSPVVEAAVATRERFGRLIVETPDTSAGREQSAFVKRLTPILAAELGDARVLVSGSKKQLDQLPCLHVLFVNATSAIVASRPAGFGTDWPMGVPRIRVASDAPSRSAAKIAEAFHVMLGDELTRELVVPGQRAVDLGAAPGGWSWWLAERGMRVIAVDNGPLSASALATGMIDHVRADGFRFRPRGRVEWLVCDMVEQPKRIAQLVAAWVVDGAARHALFNLKLPMKKRVQEVEACRTLMVRALAKAGIEFELVIKQLYHDREEATAMLIRQ